MHWIDEDVIPGAYYGETTWIWPPDYPHQITWKQLIEMGMAAPGMFPPVHDFPELLVLVGQRTLTTSATCNSMAMQMDDEIIPLESGWVPTSRPTCRTCLRRAPARRSPSDPCCIGSRDRAASTPGRRTRRPRRPRLRKKEPPVARLVTPEESKYARFLVPRDPRRTLERHGFMRPLDLDYCRPMAYIDQTVIPDAEFGCDTRWFLPGDTSRAGQVIMDEHALPHGTSIACIAMNYDDITDLCAEVELWIGGEKHVINKGFWAYIPPNVSQGPLVVRGVQKQMFFQMSWPMGEGVAKYPGGS